MYADGYYQSPLGTPPTTSDSSKLHYHKVGRNNTPPLVNGYFTPPQSRENSPSLRAISPNPQSRNHSPLPSVRDGSPTPSHHNVRRSRTNSGSRFSRAPSPMQRENSFESRRFTPEPIEIAIPPPIQFGGEQGTFGRADSRKYQKPLTLPTPPESVKDTNSQKSRYRRSDESIIIPLEPTVYVPGVGDTVSSVGSLALERDEDYFALQRERSIADRVAQFAAYPTPPESLDSPTIRSPFLPVEPEVENNDAQPRFPTPYQRRGAVKPTGKNYILNMYRQASLPDPHQAEHPLAFPEHFTFGENAYTPFYSIHAMRENPSDDTFSELSLLRRDPVTGLDTSVITLGLEPPSRRISPAGDGLITLIYPKEAVLSAMSPKTPTVPAKADQLLGPRRKRGDEERAREAIQKAYATECCRLSWNAARRRYYLYHPGIGNGGDAYLVQIEGEVGFDNLGAKGCIKLINVDTNETLVELDFTRKMLFIDTNATNKIPSDHIVDVAVSTVLTVATVEGRRMRMVRQSQSYYSNTVSAPLSSRHISNQYSEKRSRKQRGFSNFLRKLCF
ncbi:uncharacterized protein LAJ45_02605 [Morchella importuna]|uniref:uncharacterized protein n=1 Tax=Morchella importuna TaxID=1174673 RepID=UPI001E8CB8F4|nr:uncharacterized protein LAJ45_02605 [Morchella importuna]KAH8153018.1 hypothetical protein LAJ45_02605 [Morchella importuna]